MPELKANDLHDCIHCGSSFKRRSVLKRHLLEPKNDGKPRCDVLKKIIPDEVWREKILPYYKDAQPLPDLSAFIRRQGRKRSSWTDASPRTKRRRHK